MSTTPVPQPPQDWFAVNAPKQSGDWFTQNAPTAAPADTRNFIQKEIDEQPELQEIPNPNNSALIGAKNLVRGMVHGVENFASHPIQSIESSVTPYMHALTPAGTLTPQAAERMGAQTQQMLQHPMYSLGNLAGPALFAGGIAAAAPHPISSVVDAANSARDWAQGNPDEAAMRGLHISPQSKFAQPTLDAVQGSRPFLQGAQGLKDIQSKIKPATDEIWQPYQGALERVGDNPVKGPNGEMTTVRDLEARRLELSAQLRTLRKGGPEAIQLAQQKGLTQANLLREDSQIRSVLDPQLRQAGIDPVAIRKAFAQVKTIGAKVAGKTTVGEASQPTALGRMTDIKLDNPRSWIGEPLQGVRDLIAGRPLWSANPTDMNIREAFRPNVSGPKPNFAVLPSRFAGLLERGPIELSGPAESSNPLSQPPPVDATTRSVRLGRLLPAQTGGPIELPYVPEMGGDEQLAALMHYLRNSKPPKGLPAKASAIRLSPPSK